MSEGAARGDAAGAVDPHDEPDDPVGRVVRASFATEQAVYGVILTAGLIAVAGLHVTDALDVFTFVAATVVVFWLAHVYAGTVAHHGLEHGRVIGLGAAFRLALQQSWGLLASAAIPSLFLLLGVFGVIDDETAIWAALWVGVVVLGILGWIAFARRGAPWPIRLAGSVVTALFGVAMILLKAFVH